MPSRQDGGEDEGKGVQRIEQKIGVPKVYS